MHAPCNTQTYIRVQITNHISSHISSNCKMFDDTKSENVVVLQLNNIYNNIALTSTKGWLIDRTHRQSYFLGVRL